MEQQPLWEEASFKEFEATAHSTKYHWSRSLWHPVCQLCTTNLIILIHPIVVSSVQGDLAGSGCGHKTNNGQLFTKGIRKRTQRPCYPSSSTEWYAYIPFSHPPLNH